LIAVFAGNQNRCPPAHAGVGRFQNARVDEIRRHVGGVAWMLLDRSQERRQTLRGGKNDNLLRRQDRTKPIHGLADAREIAVDPAALRIDAPAEIRHVKDESDGRPTFGRNPLKPDRGAVQIAFAGIGHDDNVGRADTSFFQDAAITRKLLRYLDKIRLLAGGGVAIEDHIGGVGERWGRRVLRHDRRIGAAIYIEMRRDPAVAARVAPAARFAVGMGMAVVKAGRDDE
ncbi:MAG: hypothetical protein ACREES_05150, partial [Stellaceae bacterium]